MRSKGHFLSNGYASRLTQSIIESYASKVYINPYDIQALKTFAYRMSAINFIGPKRLKIVGVNGVIPFEIDLVTDTTREPGKLRFEGKYEEPTLLFADEVLDSGRQLRVSLTSEDGSFLIL